MVVCVPVVDCERAILLQWILRVLVQRLRVTMGIRHSPVLPLHAQSGLLVTEIELLLVVVAPIFPLQEALKGVRGLANVNQGEITLCRKQSELRSATVE